MRYRLGKAKNEFMNSQRPARPQWTIDVTFHTVCLTHTALRQRFRWLERNIVIYYIGAGQDGFLGARRQ